MRPKKLRNPGLSPLRMGFSRSCTTLYFEAGETQKTWPQRPVDQENSENLAKVRFVPFSPGAALQLVLRPGELRKRGHSALLTKKLRKPRHSVLLSRKLTKPGIARFEPFSQGPVRHISSRPRKLGEPGHSASLTKKTQKTWPHRPGDQEKCENLAKACFVCISPGAAS